MASWWLDSLGQPSPPPYFRWRTWSLEVWRSTWLVCRVTKMANLQLCMWVFNITNQNVRKEINAKFIFQSLNSPNCLVFTQGHELDIPYIEDASENKPFKVRGSWTHHHDCHYNHNQSSNNFQAIIMLIIICRQQNEWCSVDWVKTPMENFSVAKSTSQQSMLIIEHTTTINPTTNLVFIQIT